MHHFTKLSLVLGSVISFQTFAATFTAPDFFTIMYMDREAPSLMNDENKITLSEGKHELVLRYDQTLDKYKEEERFKSEPIIVDLIVEADTDVLRVDSVEPKKYRLAEKYEEKPEFTIVNQQGELANYQSELLPFKSGFQLGRDYLKEIKEYKSAKVAEDKVAVLEAQLADVKQESRLTQTQTDSSALETLKTLYKVVDSETQTAFKIWIIDPTMSAKETTEKLTILKDHYNKLNAMEQKNMQVWMIK
ncbi:YccT family protein [Psychromonas sp. PT13]|uniref:YccT family protein n=1 Tax=Psychromonas sp. PT13 TaxID=3439547 RepID=UPI003EB81B2C